MPAAKALVSLRICPDLPEPLLLNGALSTEILYTGSNYKFIYIAIYIQAKQRKINYVNKLWLNNYFSCLYNTGKIHVMSCKSAIL